MFKKFLNQLWTAASVIPYKHRSINKYISGLSISQTSTGWAAATDLCRRLVCPTKVYWPGGKLRKLGRLRNVGISFPTFSLPPFRIWPNTEIGNLEEINLRKKFRAFRTFQTFQVFDLAKVYCQFYQRNCSCIKFYRCFLYKKHDSYRLYNALLYFLVYKLSRPFGNMAPLFSTVITSTSFKTLN